MNDADSPATIHAKWNGFTIVGAESDLQTIRTDLDQLNATANGAGLLRKLEPLGCTIEAVQSNACWAAGPNRVYYNPAARGCRPSQGPPEFCHDGHGGHYSGWNIVANWVYLHHELAHLLLIRDGHATSPVRECMAVGLGKFFTEREYSENRLRCEIGKMIRPCYGSECQRFAPPDCAASGDRRKAETAEGSPQFLRLPADAASATPASSDRVAEAAPQFPGCSDEQRAMLAAGISEAQSTWLPAAIAVLSASPLRESTLRLVKKHFKTGDRRDIDTIRSNFERVRQEVGSSTARYECESEHLWCPNDPNEPRAFTYALSSTTSHFCPGMFGVPGFQMTRTVIHETAHRAGLRGDIYIDMREEAYASMWTGQAIENADSYAAFAGELTGKWLP